MTHDRGGRICDQAATRDECLQVWALPPGTKPTTELSTSESSLLLLTPRVWSLVGAELPPPPPCHMNVELFYTIEIEKGDPFERVLLANHQAHEL